MIRVDGPYVRTIRDQKLFLPSGDVGRWCRRISREMDYAGKTEAPTGASSGRVNKTRANAAYPVGSLKANTYSEVRQRGAITDMIHSVPAIIEYVSAAFTLLPGDVILTGTPEGVGPMGVGDEVDIVVEGIGTLTNTVRRRD